MKETYSKEEVNRIITGVEAQVRFSTLEEIEGFLTKRRYTDRRLNDSVHWFQIKTIIKELKQRGDTKDAQMP